MRDPCGQAFHGTRREVDGPGSGAESSTRESRGRSSSSDLPLISERRSVGVGQCDLHLRLLLTRRCTYRWAREGRQVLFPPVPPRRCGRPSHDS